MAERVYFAAYRVIYGLVLMVFLANVFSKADFTANRTQVSVLMVALAVTLSGALVLLLGFSRIRTTAFWVLTLVWEVLFVWYAWFSPASPFLLHELHSLDATEATRQINAHYVWAGTMFALLFAWFLSLPVTRSIYEKRTQTPRC